jgi:CRISPR-associated endonuclease Csn1
MAKILGLDLGTNSIGWAVVDEEESKPILYKGVRIFSEGVKIEKGTEISKAAERTKFRSARRIKFRRKLRKYQTLKVLINHNMCPLSLEELELWRQKKIYPTNEEFIKWLRTHEDKNPYFFRAKAVNEKLVNPLQLGRAIYHLAQRRGFLSNRLEAPDDDSTVESYKSDIEALIESSNNLADLYISINEYLKNNESEDQKTKSLLNSIKKLNSYISKQQGLNFEEEKDKFYNILNKKENLGKVKQSIAGLSDKIKAENCKTLGEYFYKLYQKNEKIRSCYTHRESHYLYEFEQICETQKLKEDLKNELHKAIFYQRPLRSQKGLVGICTFEKNKPRCPISHPLYEEYRMYAFINNIRYKTNLKDNFEPLTHDMIEKIIPLFYRKSKKQFDFTEIAQKISGKNLRHAYEKDENARNVDIIFNYNYKTSVSGNPVSAYLKDILGNEWKTKEIEYDYQFKGKAKKAKVNYQDIWHVLFTYESNDKLKEFAQTKLKLAGSQIGTFLRTPIKQGYASLSLKAIKKILPLLIEGQLFSYAVFLANIEEVIGKEYWKGNEDLIRNELKRILDTHNEKAKKDKIVNELIGWFKKEYNNSDSKYTLDELDKKEIHIKIETAYGKISWAKFSEENRNNIIKEISDKFQEQLRKSSDKYIKIERIDEKFIRFLDDNFNISDKNIKKLYHPSDIEVYKKAVVKEDGKRYLGSPLIDSIKNPMAMKTLHQLRHLVNALIKEGIIDELTQIHIELARDLNDANQRKAIESWQRKQEEERKNAIIEIKKLYFEECKKEIEPSENEILKYLLWEEQKHFCLYKQGSNNQIRISDFVGADPKFDIEHTIPRSLSYDNSRENLTLCDNEYNREIKKNKIPFECPNYQEILTRIEPWKKLISDLNDKIEATKRQSKAAQTKEMKDKAIQRKHLLTIERDYWQHKYDRFTMKEVKSGFKNSQLNDTRIMTKYATSYMKTIFDRVFTVKGSAVADFRKIWGIQPEYEKKERVNHIHHAIDALVIACMTKPKYDLLAKYYHDKESSNKKELEKTIYELKPWPTFTQDVKSIVDDTLIYHAFEDNATKTTIKRLRKRSKIQYNVGKQSNSLLNNDENKKPILLKGDSIRGSLHKDTVYGAILDKISNSGEPKIKYVVRTKIQDLSASDIKNIVDRTVKDKIEAFVNENGFGALKKDIPIWMNEEKRIRIKKIRLFSPSVTKPIHLKKHKDLSKHEHKQYIHVTNDSNFIMSIYEGNDLKGKQQREFEILNLLDAGEYYKISNISHRKSYPLVPQTKQKSGIDLPLKHLIKPGISVLLYENSPLEIWESTNKEIIKRLYKVVGLSSMLLQEKYNYGIIFLRHVSEARQTTDPELKVKDGDFKIDEPYIPMRKFLHTRFNALIENIDFKMTDLGEIKKINKQ